jgi:hypothetical protein
MKRLGFLLVCAGIAVPAAAQNLVANGDFETGLLGLPWRTFQADWSSGIARYGNSTEPGHLGNYCLKLHGGSGSFGIYQEVATTPGSRYKIDAYWKGVKVGDPVWFEIILIDGPFSMAAADDNPQPNFMYAYDPAPGSFDWVWAHDLNGTPADRNGRNGIRTASGSKMTVVLKTGGFSGMDAFFDNVSLVKLVRADFDADGDVDLEDFVFFQTCFNGPNRSPSATCAVNADFDGDGDVDLSDFSVFQACFNGPNRPPTCP